MKHQVKAIHNVVKTMESPRVEGVSHIKKDKESWELSNLGEEGERQTGHSI